MCAAVFYIVNHQYYGNRIHGGESLRLAAFWRALKSIRIEDEVGLKKERVEREESSSLSMVRSGRSGSRNTHKIDHLIKSIEPITDHKISWKGGVISEREATEGDMAANCCEEKKASSILFNERPAFPILYGIY